jgi:general secretion pathway protein J
MTSQSMKKITDSVIPAPTRVSGPLKNVQMQGAQTLRNEAYLFIRRNDEGCSATQQMGIFQRPHSGGFTLVEILIAIFILVLVMSTVYVSYSGILKNSRQLEEEGAIYKMARTSMDRIIKDLSSLQTSAGVFDLRAEKKTLSNREFYSIYFWSASHLVFSENDEEGRPASIGYDVREDEDHESFSLWRTDVSGAKPDKGKNTDGGFIICRNIDAFRLTFYDTEGRETDSWDSSSSTGGDNTGKTPAAVKIELFLVNTNDREKPYKFMTKVFLPVKK